jgi:hypothetical protein
MPERDRTAEEIQREIALIRDRLVDNVTTLEVVMRDKVDWRRPIRERPVAWLLGGFVVGLVIALK